GPEFFLKSHLQRNLSNFIRVPDGAVSIRDVNTSIIDLDGDGRPEVVILKSLENKPVYERFGPGVWRLKELKPMHELDDANTSTRFVSSLESILFAPRSLTGDTLTDWQCSSLDSRAVQIPLLEGIRRNAISRVRRLELEQKQSQLVTKEVDRLT